MLQPVYFKKYPYFICVFVGMLPQSDEWLVEELYCYLFLGLALLSCKRTMLLLTLKSDLSTNKYGLMTKEEQSILKSL